MESRDVSEALLRAVARVCYRQEAEGSPAPPDWDFKLWSQEARELIEDLEAEGLEVRPKALNEDINVSEAGL